MAWASKQRVMESTCWKIALFPLMDWGQGDRDMAPQHLNKHQLLQKLAEIQEDSLCDRAWDGVSAWEGLRSTSALWLLSPYFPHILQI